MEITIMMELTRMAKKGGGDRYEAKIGQPMPGLTIYFPQEISRTHGTPVTNIEITVRLIEDED